MRITFSLTNLLTVALLLYITGCAKAEPAQYPDGWPLAMLPLPRAATQTKLPPRERRYSGDDIYICGHRNDKSREQHFKRWVMSFKCPSTWGKVVEHFEMHLASHDYLRFENVPVQERCMRSFYGNMDESYYISPDSMFRFAVISLQMKKVGNNPEAYKGYMLEIRCYDEPTKESLEGVPLDKQQEYNVYAPF